MPEKLSGPDEEEEKPFVWDASAKQGAVAVALAAALLLTGIVMSPKKGPEASTSGVPTSVPTTENVTPSVTNEEIFASFKMKIEKDPNYTPTRAERIALAKLGIAVNDGAPIPYEGDGKEEEKK